ncbi:MAG: hypothetical protein ACT4PY_01640 [Armatimonadota bacterium]
MKRVLLALIPVALLATASLAITGMYDEPWLVAQSTNYQAPPPATDSARPAPVVPPPAVTDQQRPTAPAQAPDPAKQTVQEEPIVQAAQEPEEPLPTLVVDKTPLTQAMTDLDEALSQAKLAVTALDVDSQSRHIQQTVNFLAGAADPNFRLMAGSPDTYKGVRELLVQARVTREAAEVQWIAAVQAQVEAKAKRLAELAQAGDGSSVQPPAAPSDVTAWLGPNGVLGTRNMRPEDQATELVARAIKHATEALQAASNRPQQSIGDGDFGSTNYQASGESMQIMESIVRQLEAAKKIVQIAIDR